MSARANASLSNPRRPASRSTRLPCLSATASRAVIGSSASPCRRSVVNPAFLNALLSRVSFVHADREQGIGISCGAYGAMNGRGHCPDDRVVDVLVCQHRSNIQQQQRRLARAACPHRDCIPARWREVTSSLCLRCAFSLCSDVIPRAVASSASRASSASLDRVPVRATGIGPLTNAPASSGTAPICSTRCRPARTAMRSSSSNDNSATQPSTILLSVGCGICSDFAAAA